MCGFHFCTVFLISCCVDPIFAIQLRKLVHETACEEFGRTLAISGKSGVWFGIVAWSSALVWRDAWAQSCRMFVVVFTYVLRLLGCVVCWLVLCHAETLRSPWLFWWLRQDDYITTKGVQHTIQAHQSKHGKVLGQQACTPTYKQNSVNAMLCAKVTCEFVIPHVKQK